jgi:hypothetical protein
MRHTETGWRETSYLLRLRKRRPTCARFELGRRFKQAHTATRALVLSGSSLQDERGAVWCLGAAVAQHKVLLVRELGQPLLNCFVQRVRRSASGDRCSSRGSACHREGEPLQERPPSRTDPRGSPARAWCLDVRFFYISSWAAAPAVLQQLAKKAALDEVPVWGYCAERRAGCRPTREE